MKIFIEESNLKDAPIPLLVSIDIIPANSSIRDIDTLQYIAIGNYDDGSTPDITDQVTWSSTDTGVTIISNSAGSEGLATGVETGTTTIEATMDSVISSTSLTTTYVPTWDLEIVTTGAGQNMQVDFEGPVNMRIYWGDGTIQTTTNTSITHTYSSAGTYTLSMKGMASRISFSNADAQSRLTRILSVVQGIEGLTSFALTFNGCTNLTGAIPAGLFDNVPLVTSFAQTFESTNLTGAIPAGLFDNNTLVTSFLRTFRSCGGLASIPAGLFDNNTLVTNLGRTFAGCTGITSAVPTLWISYPGAAHDGCFINVTNASNYGSIPADWK